MIKSGRPGYSTKGGDPQPHDPGFDPEVPFSSAIDSATVAQMKMHQIVRNPAAKERLDRWYEFFLKRVPVPAERREVTTRFGRSHILIAGHDSNPPLVCLHGSLASSAHLVAELAPLLESFRIFAPDLPGQSARGPQTRLPFDGKAHARWMLEVLNELELDQVNLLGVSWGGYVALQTASAAQQRIRRLALVVPAGVVAAPWLVGLQFFLPLMAYRLSPSPARLRRFLTTLFTSWDDDWAAYMGDALLDFVLDFRPPPLFTDDSFRDFGKPVLTLAADRDVTFPGDKMATRMRQLIPHGETEIMANCGHCPPTTPEFRLWLAHRLSEFFLANP
jgi:2-hydroxy-6-oxonona-2,4-dienedioate hydrolase